MLMSAPYEATCRGCALGIQRGKQVSWVEHVGPYHLACTPDQEDQASARVAASHKTRTKPSPDSSAGRPSEKLVNIWLAVGVIVASAVILAGAAVPMPYEYYSLVRVIVCGVSVFLGLSLRSVGMQGWSSAVLVVAALYNPLLPVHLSRALWLPINLTTVIALAVACYLTVRHRGRRT